MQVAPVGKNRVTCDPPCAREQLNAVRGNNLSRRVLLPTMPPWLRDSMEGARNLGDAKPVFYLGSKELVH